MCMESNKQINHAMKEEENSNGDKQLEYRAVAV